MQIQCLWNANGYEYTRCILDNDTISILLREQGYIAEHGSAQVKSICNFPIRVGEHVLPVSLSLVNRLWAHLRGGEYFQISSENWCTLLSVADCGFV